MQLTDIMKKQQAVFKLPAVAFWCQEAKTNSYLKQPGQDCK